MLVTVTWCTPRLHIQLLPPPCLSSLYLYNEHITLLFRAQEVIVNQLRNKWRDHQAKKQEASFGYNSCASVSLFEETEMMIPDASDCFQNNVGRHLSVLQTVPSHIADFYLKRFGRYICSKYLGEMVGKVYFC